MNPALFRLLRNYETRVHELSYLFWECTSRCNFNCRHCGSDCGLAGGLPDMPAEDFLKALDTIPEKGRVEEFTVVITGGEPLMRPDIAEAGAAISKKGFRWGMVTNGWLYDSQMSQRLLDAGMGALTISLDGLRESHEWMRGTAGSYERAVRAISLAVRSPRLYFDVVTCVNKRNIGELEQIHDLLSGLGVRQWRLFTIIPIGRAAEDPMMHLDNAESLRLMEFIAAKREEAKNDPDGWRMNVTFGCEGFLGRFEERARAGRFFCRAGVIVASVLSDGRICACPNIDRDRFSQGNIYQDNLWEVWNSRFKEFRDRRWTRTGKCAGCRQWSNCLGNGMHNWHGECAEVLNCHYEKLHI